jgi:uncharacterized protein (TIGR00730 family)
MALQLSQHTKQRTFPHKKIERVAFFGFADSKVEDNEYKLAFETAKLCAEHGFTVVDGGGPGVMEAASRGAKEANGKTIGVTFYPTGAKHFEGRAATNVLDEEIVTKNYLERTLRLLEFGQVYMIFNGGTGTLSEFGMAWGMARLYLGHHKPLILVGKHWYEIVAALTRNMRIRDEELEVFSVVDSPAEAVRELLSLQEELKNTPYDPNYVVADDEKAFIL